MPPGPWSAMPPAPVATPPCGTVLPALEAELLDWAGAICVDSSLVVAVVVVLARERGRGAEREGGRRGGEDGQDAVLLEEHRNPFGRSRRTAGGRRVPIVREDPSPDNNASGSAERGSRSATSAGGAGRRAGR